MVLERLNGTSFDWQSWRAGWPADIGVHCREVDIIEKGYILRKYAIGWCPGEETLCRPKPGQVALMVLKDEDMFWFHLTKREFKEVFGGINEKG